MKRCANCHEPIRKPATNFNPWIHTNGMYTCAKNPETIARAFDERWEKVYAQVKTPEYDIDNDGADETYLHYVEFRIDVLYGGRFFYVIQRVHENEIAAFKGNLYSLLLDEMVVGLDEYLADFEKERGDG